MKIIFDISKKTFVMKKNWELRQKVSNPKFINSSVFWLSKTWSLPGEKSLEE